MNLNDLGPISQSIHELIIQILEKCMLLLMNISLIHRGLKFAHVTTAQLSCHVQICDPIESSEVYINVEVYINDSFHKISVMSS